MSKLDLSDVFRHILVNAQDWELLGSTWPVEIDGTVVPGYFIDTLIVLCLRFLQHSTMRDSNPWCVELFC